MFNSSEYRYKERTDADGNIIARICLISVILDPSPHPTNAQAKALGAKYLPLPKR
jgi:hypothetical protein